MKHLVSVTETSPTESHWVARSPAGKTVEWDATVINEHPNELIAWRTLEGSEVAHAGSVRFKAAPQNLGTEVTVAFEYMVSGGKLAAKIAKLSGKEPGQEVEKDLYRLKALLEAGEAPTNRGQSAGNNQEEEKEKA